MVNQYPDILRFTKIIGGSTTEDENGDTVIIPGANVTTDIKCRFEINLKGKTFPTNDGEHIEYNWDVYAPLNQDDVPERVDFKGFDKNGEMFTTGIVKRFKRGEMNITIII